MSKDEDGNEGCEQQEKNYVSKDRNKNGGSEQQEKDLM